MLINIVIVLVAVVLMVLMERANKVGLNNPAPFYVQVIITIMLRLRGLMYTYMGDGNVLIHDKQTGWFVGHDDAGETLKVTIGVSQIAITAIGISLLILM